MATSSTRDYYQVLGVPRTATDKDIRTAYRRLARKYHPDLNPGDKNAEARFKELQAAYDVLSDAEKRKKYDQFGPNWEEVERARSAGFSGGFTRRGPGGTRVEFEQGGDLGDLWESIFGGVGGTANRNRAGFRPRQRKGDDREVATDVSLEEAYQGATRVVTSPSANGQSRRVEVKIPPGVKSGARIRLAGEGEPGAGGGEAGDLFLVVTVRPHGVFERRDDDLFTDVSLPVTTAVLGGEIDVPSLKGKNGKVILKIPPETQNGTRFRIPGHGMPRASGFGDLYATVKLVLPTKLSTRERQLFEELQSLRAS
jgi:DnaJ-class molecular chaperone